MCPWGMIRPGWGISAGIVATGESSWPFVFSGSSRNGANREKRVGFVHANLGLVHANLGLARVLRDLFFVKSLIFNDLCIF